MSSPQRFFRVVVELGIDLLEIPGVFQLDNIEDDLCLGRDAFDVRLDPFGKVRELLVEDEVQFIDWQRLLLDETDCRPPCVPARGPAAAMRILLRPENRYDRCFHGAYCTTFRSRMLYDRIETIISYHLAGSNNLQSSWIWRWHALCVLLGAAAVAYGRHLLSGQGVAGSTPARGGTIGKEREM